jgi:hypothetical protein
MFAEMIGVWISKEKARPTMNMEASACRLGALIE